MHCPRHRRRPRAAGLGRGCLSRRLGALHAFPRFRCASTSFKDKISNFFSGATQRDPQPVTNAQTPDFDCPFIDIRQGASTLTIPPPPPDGANEAMTLKYQGIFVRAARDCTVVSGQMVLRVGVQGRIIVGPAGGPGQVDVPLRVAVVTSPQAGSKLVITKLIHIPVTVGPNDGNVDFTHIEEGFSFPMPSAAALDLHHLYRVRSRRRGAEDPRPGSSRNRSPTRTRRSRIASGRCPANRRSGTDLTSRAVR